MYGIKPRRNATRRLMINHTPRPFDVTSPTQVVPFIQRPDVYGEIGAPPREWGQRYVDRHGVPYLRLTAAAVEATAVMIRHTAVVKGPRRFVGVLFYRPPNLE